MRHTASLAGLLIILALVFLAGLLSGCSSFTTPEARHAEIAWLALDAVDTAQTVTIARSPGCLYEANPIAVQAYGGPHPDVGRVLAVNSVLAFAHWELGAWLDRNAERSAAADPDDDTSTPANWYIARGAFYALSFLGSGHAVLGNFMMGVRPLSHATCAP